MRTILITALVLITALAFSGTVIAGDGGTDKLEKLEQKIEALTDEVEAMKEADYESGGETDFLDRVAIGGYGELHYNDFSNTDKASTIDFHRFVLFFAYDFNDWIKFSSELELEHVLSGEGKEGEVELEQAYLDFLLSRRVNVRTGLMIVPVGIINETHEPPTFYGVERPDVDKNIIPTTWWEAGAGIFGEITPGLGYKLYLVSTPDASKFKASSGIRSGRQKVSKAKVEDFALTGRLTYTGLPGLKLGASFFTGDTAQDDPDLGDSTVTIIETDLQYSYRNLDLRALYATIDIDDAERINAKTGQVVGEKLTGWYVEGAYRVLAHRRPDTDQELAVFTRYAEYTPQDEVPAALSADPRNDVEVITVGLDYKPHPGVVIKLDYQDRDNASASVEAEDQWNLGIGYWF